MSIRPEILGVRIVVATCAVEYSGRLSTTLPAAVRAIVMKADGSVAVHSEGSSIKPLNWMTTSTEIEMPGYEESTGPTVWRFATKKEQLLVTLIEVHSDTQFILDAAEPGLRKQGTEVQLQQWLSANPGAIEEGMEFVAREFPTGAGPVDILSRDAAGAYVAVEVKRVASIGAVDQVSRYVEAITVSEAVSGPVRGLIAAFEVKPRARKLAEQRGFDWVEISTEAFNAES